MIPAYPKVAALGHRAVEDIFEGTVEVTEKIDGSQFAFGILDGELHYRSKGRQIPRHSVTESDLFYPVIQWVEQAAERGLVQEGFWYYGETLKKPKHSTLTYSRVPQNHFALFGCVDANDERAWFPHAGLRPIADTLECEVVDSFIQLEQWDAERIVAMIDEKITSQLGGVPMEGLVIKNLDKEYLYGPILFPIMTAKFVSDGFKEVHSRDWKNTNTGKGKWDVFQEQYNSEARWWKSVQHMAEDGNLLGEPKDIGQLMNRVQKDIGEECKEEILNFLWRQFGRDLMRHSVRGLPEWYKEQLALGNLTNLLDGQQ